MKKIKSLIISGLSLAAPILLSTSTYAVDPTITINDGVENLYVSSGTQASTDGTASYDASTNTLTLDGFHGDDIQVKNLENLTIQLKNDNTISMANENSWNIPQGITAYNTNLTITGTGSLKVNQTTLSGFDASASIIYANSITINSATLDFKAPAGACLASQNSWGLGSAQGTVTINGGTLKFACESAILSENIIINGGDTSVVDNFSSLITTSKNLTINNGNLTVNASGINLGSAMTFSGNIEINGGKTIIDGGQYGIELVNLYGSQAGNFVINGGTLDIINADNGIYLNDTDENSYIEFSGGTTTISAKYKTAVIFYDAENDKNITIANGMNLYPENLTVKMEHTDYNGYGYYLAANNKAVKLSILSDEEITPPTDDEQLPVPDTGSGTKAPDTGFFTGEMDGTKAIIYAGAAILGTGILYLITYIVKRSTHRNRFRK